jgi:quercetin dioxygenase-like cupin family protein
VSFYSTLISMTAIIRQSSPMVPLPTRRNGIRERRLLASEDSSHQHITLIDAEYGAEVEFHAVESSESFFVLKGSFEVLLAETTHIIGAGDLCHFPPKSSHGLRCIDGPGQFLVIFAPGALPR